MYFTSLSRPFSFTAGETGLTRLTTWRQRAHRRKQTNALVTPVPYSRRQYQQQPSEAGRKKGRERGREERRKEKYIKRGP